MVRTASEVEVNLHNPSRYLAFQVAVAAQDHSGEDIPRVLWSDNYVELMPGESLILKAGLPQDLPGEASVVVSGWNVPQIVLPLK